MRYSFLGLSAAFVAVLAVLGCNSAGSTHQTNSNTAAASPPVQTETTYADGARRITIAEAQELIKKKQAVVIDVRNQASYDAGHIPGSKLIPAGEILNHIDELPRDKTIITYCS